MDRERFDIELLDEKDPFEIDDDWQRFHLAKHPMLDPDDVREVWASDPLFYPAHPDGRADWLMVAQVPEGIMVVPLAPARRRTRPGRAASTRRLQYLNAGTCATDDDENHGGYHHGGRDDRGLLPGP